MVDAGFQVVTHASNHALDKGMEGITDSIEIWKNKGVLTVGIRENAESMEEIRILERNGIKVAFLNYTATLNYHIRPAGKKYCVNVMKPKSKGMIREQICKARRIADIVVVLPHWGCEYLSEPDSSQVAWGNFFASCGADIIIGTHPHVVQNMDFIITKDKRMVPCFYSLGNFISCQVKPFTALGAIADIEITKDASGIRIEKSEMIPVITHTDENYSMFKVYPMDAYNDTLAGHNRIFKVIEKDYDLSVNTEYYKKLFKDILNKKAKEYNLFKTPGDVRRSNIQGLFYTLCGKNKK